MDAGPLFNTKFDFNEHRWRRVLGLYRNRREWVDRAATTWTGGFDRWYRDYCDMSGATRP